MSRRALSVLVLGCVALIAGGLVYTAAATVPTTRSFAVLTGAAEAPAPGDANARGAAIVTVRPGSNEVCVSVRFRRIDGTPHLMHIHQGPPGVAGPIVVNLTPGLSTRGVTCGDATPEVVQAIRSNPRGFYCNVHSTPDFEGGAIRGQLMDSDI